MHKPQPYVSEFTNTPPPPFFISMISPMSDSFIFEPLTSLTVSCIDFRVAVEELLGIKSEGQN